METGLAIVALLLLAFGGSSSSSSTTPTNGGGSKLPTNGGGSKVPGRKRGPNNRGDVWRDDAAIPRLPSPSKFDYSGNGIYIDPECGYVIEGDLFWPEAGDFVWAAVEAPTVEATLNIQEDNTIIGWIDYLTNEQGIDDPIEITWRLVEEVAPMCAEVDSEQWGEAMKLWFNDFLDRVTAYLDEGTIVFVPEDEQVA